MALGTLITATNISFSDIRRALNSGGLDQDISMQNYFRNGLYTPSYTSATNVAGVTGSTQFGTNLGLDSFRGARPSGFVYRNTLLESAGLLPPFGYRSGTFSDAPVIFKDTYENNSSTTYILKDGGYGGNGPASTSSFVRISAGSVTFTVIDNSSDFTRIWSETTPALGTAGAAAWNQQTGIGLVVGAAGRGAINPVMSAFGNSAWVYVNIGDGQANEGWKLACWNRNIVAVRGFNSGSLVRVKYAVNTSTWSTYDLSVHATSTSLQFTVTGGRAFIHGTSGFCYVSTDPTNSNSWTRLTTVETVFGSNYANTVCYNNGVCVVGGQSGRMARSTTLTDDFVVVNGANAIVNNYWFNYINARYIAAIRPYSTGFIAFGSYSRTTAWSFDGVDWYYGIGNNSLGRSLDIFQGSFYDPGLDRVYGFYTGGHYIRTDGSDLQFTLNGSTRLGISGTIVAASFNSGVNFTANNATTNGGGEAGINLNSNGTISYFSGPNPSDTVSGPTSYTSPSSSAGAGDQIQARVVNGYYTGAAPSGTMLGSAISTTPTTTAWVTVGSGQSISITSPYDVQSVFFGTLEIRKIGTTTVLSRTMQFLSNSNSP